MDAAREEQDGEEQDGGLLHRLRPPRLEDAGLEDCALPPDSIKEAFLKAATAVGSRAASIFSSDDEDDDDACLNDPWLTAAGRTDSLPGIALETEAPGGCGNQKGGGVPEVVGDRVVAGIGDVIGTDGESDEIVGGELREEEEKDCVDALQGLKLGKKRKSEVEEEEEEEESGKLVLGTANLI